MKILYVSPGKLPSNAANSVHVMKMAQAFSAHGQTVALAFSPGERVSQTQIFSQYGVQPVFTLAPIETIAPFARRAFFAMNTVWKALREKYDLVFSRCIPTAYLSALFGLKTILEIHASPDSFSSVPRWMFMNILHKKSFLGLVVISSALKENVLSLCSIPPEKMLVLHDGADAMDNVSAHKFEDQAAGYACQVGYTGHLYKGRGIEIILELANAFPDCFFHVVGGNAEDVAFWENECRGRANVRFYGHLAHADVAGYIAGFDVLLAPYQKKVSVHGNVGDTAAWMSPLKIFEYMASGKPIICSNIPVLREVLQNGKNCLLCLPDDIEAWKEALTKLKTDKGLANVIGRSARIEFEEKYTWTARAAAILGYIKGLNSQA